MFGRRRCLLYACAALVLPISAIDPAANAAEPPLLGEKLSREGFVSHLNERFRVWGGDGLGRVVELQLIAVEDIRLSENIAQFSLLFRGPADYALDKNTYTFKNPRSGRFALFIEPSGNDEQGLLYQVNFNLLR